MNITSIRSRLTGWLNPFIKLFIKIGITPNQLTYLSFICGIGAGVCFFAKSYILGLILLAISGGLDLIDGSVARETDNKSGFGAIADWISDKYIDGFVILSIGVSGIPIISQFTNLPEFADLAVVAIAALGSIMNTFIKPVTYSEVGYETKVDGKISDPLENVGFFGRPETIITLMAGALFNVMWLSVIIIAVCTNISLIQRVRFVYKKYGNKNKKIKK